ncbi:hypothetical protein KSP35_22110 [Aquihabitans sp. G128]|uniref:RHS repeat-associated core domain-containing protein n=1 Tax=Aquihabitans sp. G128 TaxID=2849779 RepID=UPI001C23E6D5|nr:RHS repeat-associated core domain-containing protein [Aquihabitans sp. G128]QXC60974.1 hypothetical protein KSP35_22110 [Aquihabitans sp. G128]
MGGEERTYDPFGHTTGQPFVDDSAGPMDAAWLGQHQRMTEHEDGFAQTIEMGARQYDPTLGRFLEVDPVEGGSANDYDYTSGDPVNGRDLAGTMCFIKCGWRRKARSGLRFAKHAALNVIAVGPYAVYYGTYRLRRGMRHRGWLHRHTNFLRRVERVGLRGDATIDRWKGEAVGDEGVRGYVTPWHTWTNGRLRFLRGPKVYLPGIHRNGKVDID